ncbi:MAG TPA: stage II sporulation protein M, partial [Ilumatobacteraceae bacterium]|nr:stage II sporulation protein M [Ilumatobacteraceae bacterium]
GLRIGWAVIDPGDRSRAEALREHGRTAGAVVMGLIAAFLLAALVEAFVTGRAWPTALRLVIGIAAFTIFWSWTIVNAVYGRDDDTNRSHDDNPHDSDPDYRRDEAFSSR